MCPEAPVDVAVRHDTVLRMEVTVGDFVASGRPIARLAGDDSVDAAATRESNLLYAVDS